MEQRSRPERPSRSVNNPLYQACPSCNRKFLITEIELHANLCLMKQEKPKTKSHSSSNNSNNSPRKSPKDSRHSQQHEQKYKNIPEAPTFYPTVEEFADPLKYILSIKSIAQPYGICKIVPPSSPDKWLNQNTFETNVNSDTFIIQTKVQNVRELTRRGSAESFLEVLTKFMEEKGLPLEKFPQFRQYRIQLYKLFREVVKRGGFNNVNSLSLWAEILALFDIPVTLQNVEQFQRIYVNNLLSFEQENLEINIDPNTANNTSNNKQVQHIGMRAVKLDPALKDLVNQLSNSTDGQDEDDEFGFTSGKVYSLSGFKKQSNRFARKWFNISPGETLSYTEEQAELDFWDIVDNRQDDCFVQYGSDLDVQSHGSGFSYESNCKWNLNVLPTLNQSILRFLSEHVAGITVPMMYVGMLYSCFCWHTEDNYLYSINYLHTGSSKIWYGVGSDYAPLFEEVFQRTLPDLFEKQPDLLHHLTTMLCPSFLMENGVPVVRSYQRAGEFVITFPQAYHAGFNSGFNVAEAVNFATVDWIEFGNLCVDHYRKVKRSSVFSHHELIYNALLQEENYYILYELYEEFKKIMINEEKMLQHLMENGVKTLKKWECGTKPPHSKCCFICNSECYYSAIQCACSNQIACTIHLGELCSNCKLSEITILRRYPPEYINAVHSRTRNRLLKFQPADKKRKEFDNTTSPPKRNCIENVSSFPSKSESMAC